MRKPGSRMTTTTISTRSTTPASREAPTSAKPTRTPSKGPWTTCTCHRATHHGASTGCCLQLGNGGDNLIGGGLSGILPFQLRPTSHRSVCQRARPPMRWPPHPNPHAVFEELLGPQFSRDALITPSPPASSSRRRLDPLPCTMETSTRPPATTLSSTSSPSSSV